MKESDDVYAMKVLNKWNMLKRAEVVLWLLLLLFLLIFFSIFLLFVIYYYYYIRFD